MFKVRPSLISCTVTTPQTSDSLTIHSTQFQPTMIKGYINLHKNKPTRTTSSDIQTLPIYSAKLSTCTTTPPSFKAHCQHDSYEP
ncbi:hypothetical protein M404DRAFT_998783 [Pisolithus tinctorius Marx 270]|uniref:Uncharacterized protein n=1 Tax=Pisolithus tinctorius Marx 270 TaxID=870435 RepID=A0A0C3PFG2_PISTI|nr:hypothetical protein M404DRAFT_998783 [Pisolithus tinctorius Marx 270]